MEPTFRDLCRLAFERRDAEAQVAILVAQRATVFRIACRITGDKHLAEDVVQEVEMCVVDLWGEPDKWERASIDSMARLRQWMNRTAINVSLQLCRYRRVRRADPLDEAHPVASKHPEPPELAVAAENEASLRAALERLSLMDRSVLALIAENQSYAEAAELVGVSVPAFTSRLARARSRLHEALKDVAPVLAERFSRKSPVAAPSPTPGS